MAQMKLLLQILAAVDRRRTVLENLTKDGILKRLIVTATVLFAIFLFPKKSEANCSKNLVRLIREAKLHAKPSDSDFNSVLSSVRMRAHLILREELDNSVEQIWWQPKGRYFKAFYQSKNSKDSVITLFDRQDGLWAYQVNSKSGGDSVCISNRHVSTALSNLKGKD